MENHVHRGQLSITRVDSLGNSLFRILTYKIICIYKLVAKGNLKRPVNVVQIIEDKRKISFITSSNQNLEK